MIDTAKVQARIEARRERDRLRKRAWVARQTGPDYPAHVIDLLFARAQAAKDTRRWRAA